MRRAVLGGRNARCGIEILGKFQPAGNLLRRRRNLGGENRQIGCLHDEPDGLLGTGPPDDHATLRGLGCGGNAIFLEGLAVQNGAVARDMDDVDGIVGERRVEVVAGERMRAHHVLVIAIADDQLALGHLSIGGELLKLPDDLGGVVGRAGRRGGDVGLVRHVERECEMAVRIDKGRHHGPTAQVDELRRRALFGAEHRSLGANRNDLAGLDRNRFGGRHLVVHGHDRAAEIDRIGIRGQGVRWCDCTEQEQDPKFHCDPRRVRGW